MKLTYKAYNIETSIETDYDDTTINDFWERCRHLALAIGFHIDNVNEVFGEEV